MTASEIVIDASALVRGILGEGAAAAAIVAEVWDGTLEAHAPDLIGPEATHALVRLARAGRLDPRDARQLADDIDRSPLRRHASAGQASTACSIALSTGLSGYDAFYAVLAEALEAPLVTADRRLADAVRGAVLVA